MNDESIMPFGVHQCKKLEDVPAKYLIWLYDNNKCSGVLKEYIKDNLEVLYKECNI